MCDGMPGVDSPAPAAEYHFPSVSPVTWQMRPISAGLVSRP